MWHGVVLRTVQRVAKLLCLVVQAIRCALQVRSVTMVLCAMRHSSMSEIARARSTTPTGQSMIPCMACITFIIRTMLVYTEAAPMAMQYQEISHTGRTCLSASGMIRSMTVALSTLDQAPLLMARWCRCTQGSATQRPKVALEAPIYALQCPQTPQTHYKPTGRKRGQRTPLSRTPEETLQQLGGLALVNGDSQLLIPRLSAAWISRRGIVWGKHLGLPVVSVLPSFHYLRRLLEPASAHRILSQLMYTRRVMVEIGCVWAHTQRVP